MPNWLVDDELSTVLDGVREVHVHVDGGEVAIAAGDCPSHLLAERLSGDSITIELNDGVLDIRYDRPRLFSLRHGNRARIELTVPAFSDVMVRTASASFVAAGLIGETSVRSASGDITLDRIGGRVHAHTASGDLEAREPSGTLRFETASGDLTVVAGTPSAVSAKTASGSLILDLEPVTGGEYELATVSGAVLLRLPDDASTNVDVRTVSGRLDTTFDLDRSRSGPASRHLRGTIGSGSADLTVRTVSGRVAVLRPVGVRNSGVRNG